MSDHYSEPLSGDDSAPVYETSWARISLDFGPRGYELAEEIAGEEDQGDPAERIRREIQQMIEAVRGADSISESEFIELDNMELTAEVFEQLCDGVSPEELKELAGEVEGATDAEPTEPEADARPGETERADNSEETLGEPLSEEEARAEEEMERRITEATAEDVVRELLLAAVDLPQLMVYEADETTVNVYVLCVNENDEWVTAEVDEKGRIAPGLAFESFAAELMELLPARGGICAEQDSYSFSVPVTELGEELTVDADSTCAALVEISMDELTQQVPQLLLTCALEAAPSSNGWVLLSADYMTLALVIDQLSRPAVVVASTDNSHQLSFVLPGGFNPTFDEGSVGEWMQGVVGTPSADISGVLIDLHWGANKVLTRYLPQRSVALDTLWALPGLLPDPLSYVRLDDEIENLTWIYNLDDTESKRLRNYIEDTGSDTGMESVLQLLGYSVEVARVADARADMTHMPGYRAFAPDADEEDDVPGSESSTLAFVSGESHKKPGMLDGVAQLGASGILALIAARRRTQGVSSQNAALASAALASAGISEIVMARTLEKLQKIKGEQKAGESSVQTPSRHGKAAGNRGAARVRDFLDSSELGEKAHRAGSEAKKRTREQTQKFLRKFFGQE
ncbi:hypothetical protein [Rothia sp. ZJ932]|uniref:hypothetical protein n=1 Tax=Rothia sp. ZJ932 TaxID=2810516 RepID=UPI0019678077|nr:hypothetical protein [Rothia sp. ZJ932]QRZ62348.1 hypothetical protein JR346_04450 [Rothia sp. ZJ932]